MTKVDVSAYLIEVYQQTELIYSRETEFYEHSTHLSAFEQFWIRQQHFGLPLPTPVYYLLIMHLNLLKGYTRSIQGNLIHPDFEARITKLKGELLAHFGQANDLVLNFMTEGLELEEEEPQD